MKKSNLKKKPTRSKKPISQSKTISSKESPLSANIESRVFHPDILKNDLVRQTIITVLWKKEEATIHAMLEDLKKEIGHHFDGDIELYFEKVKADLEQRKLLEQSPGKRPPHYRLAQKLERSDDDSE